MSFRVLIPLNEKWMDDYESGARKERPVAVVAYLKIKAPTCLVKTRKDHEIYQLLWHWMGVGDHR